MKNSINNVKEVVELRVSKKVNSNEGSVNSKELMQELLEKVKPFVIYRGGIGGNNEDSWQESALSINIAVSKKKIELIELLINFQNFLVMDGQLNIDADEVKKNAEIFLK